MASAQQGSGVGGSVVLLVRELEQLGGVQLILTQTSGMPVVGPHLLMPLRARLARAEVFHGPAHSLPLTRLGIPSVVTINDLAIYDHPEWFPDRQWVSTRVLVPRSVRSARIVVCPSQATRRSLLERFRMPPDRCRVISLGVDPVFAASAPPSERARLRQSFRLPERFILQVGTVSPRKNFVGTLRALAAIPATERVPLVVAGEFGWKFEPVLGAVHDLDLTDWVRFLGYVRPRDLPTLYQLASLFVFPSLDEGFGLPILEAFAAGTPVVAADAGSIPEVAGDAAWLVPAEDTGAFASAMHTLLTDGDRGAPLVERGRRRAAGFTWRATAQAYLRIYREAAGRPSPAPSTSATPPVPS
ncbi:MAG: glycosyltransferase family 4 protein [Chloroflexi bacterium]|nr:MAG: glycosyltransferase family 4 protein [Chloroflexota bacterium]